MLLHGLTATRRNVVQGSRLLARAGLPPDRLRRPRPRRVRARAEPGLRVRRIWWRTSRPCWTRSASSVPVLVGSSMGAATAMAFALEHPERVRALVQITPAYDGRARETAELDHWDALAEALETRRDRRVRRPLRRQRPARALPRGRAAGHPPADGAPPPPRRRRRRRCAWSRARRPSTGSSRSRSSTCRCWWSAAATSPTPATRSRSPRSTRAGCRAARLVVEEPGKSPLAWQGAQLSRAIAELPGRQA